MSIADPAHPALVNSISVAPGSPNSVAVDKGVVAVAVEAPVKTDPGTIQFYDADGHHGRPSATVGALPDMLTFTRNHKFLLVANEGEPSGYSGQGVDPVGSVSVIDLHGNKKKAPSVRTAGFDGVTIPAGVRIFGPGADAAHDLEPEYLPDGIGAYKARGKTYLVTANEGDSRADWPPFNEEARVSALDLDNDTFPKEAALKNNAALGRLTVTRTLGDTGNDGDYEALYVFGGRSFSIWSEDGDLVFDSGDAFEQTTAAQLPGLFNSESGAGFDTRSDNKGPEPEGLALAKIEGRTYAFIGFERIGGVTVYDVTDPHAPVFVQYANPAPATDRAPEGVLFIKKSDSPTHTALLVIANEASGTTTIYEVGS